MKPRIFKTCLQLFFGIVCAHAGSASAYSAIAAMKGEPIKTIYYATNFANQKAADKAAIEGCQSTAKKAGLNPDGNKCIVALRSKVPGYGAISCGSNGCGLAMGHDSAQSAIDTAYTQCTESYAECQQKNITNWPDFKGYPPAREARQSISSTDCRPRTNYLRCSSTCNNGSCIVSYENGCKMRVQVNAKYDAFRNQWDYPAPSC